MLSCKKMLRWDAQICSGPSWARITTMTVSSIHRWQQGTKKYIPFCHSSKAYRKIPIINISLYLPIVYFLSVRITIALVITLRQISNMMVTKILRPTAQLNPQPEIYSGSARKAPWGGAFFVLASSENWKKALSTLLEFCDFRLNSQYTNNRNLRWGFFFELASFKKRKKSPIPLGLFASFHWIRHSPIIASKFLFIL